MLRKINVKWISICTAGLALAASAHAADPTTIAEVARDAKYAEIRARSERCFFGRIRLSQLQKCGRKLATRGLDGIGERVDRVLTLAVSEQRSGERAERRGSADLVGFEAEDVTTETNQIVQVEQSLELGTQNFKLLHGGGGHV